MRHGHSSYGLIALVAVAVAGLVVLSFRTVLVAVHLAVLLLRLALAVACWLIALVARTMATLTRPRHTVVGTPAPAPRPTRVVVVPQQAPAPVVVADDELAVTALMDSSLHLSRTEAEAFVARWGANQILSQVGMVPTP